MTAADICRERGQLYCKTADGITGYYELLPDGRLECICLEGWNRIMCRQIVRDGVFASVDAIPEMTPIDRLPWEVPDATA